MIKVGNKANLVDVGGQGARVFGDEVRNAFILDRPSHGGLSIE